MTVSPIDLFLGCTLARYWLVMPIICLPCVYSPTHWMFWLTQGYHQYADQGVVISIVDYWSYGRDTGGERFCKISFCKCSYMLLNWI